MFISKKEKKELFSHIERLQKENDKIKDQLWDMENKPKFKQGETVGDFIVSSVTKGQVFVLDNTHPHPYYKTGFLYKATNLKTGLIYNLEEDHLIIESKRVQTPRPIIETKKTEDAKPKKK